MTARPTLDQLKAAEAAVEALGIDLLVFAAYLDAKQVADDWRELEAELEDDEDRTTLAEYARFLAEEHDVCYAAGEAFFDNAAKLAYLLDPSSPAPTDPQA